MNLSIIIPTRNRANELAVCLESIQRQHSPDIPYEVIVSDNDSVDSTKEIVNKYQTEIEHLLYFHVPQPGLHEGRHIGVLKSRSEWLAFLDDDVELPLNWVENVLNTIGNNREAILIGSRVLPKFLVKPPKWILQKWTENKILGELSIIDPGDEPKRIDPFHVFGCSFIIKKEFLVEIGGFHPDGMPWDSIRFRGDGESYVSRELKNRGIPAFYSPEIITYHRINQERMTNEYFNKRHYMQGISDAYTYLRSSKLEKTDVKLKDESLWTTSKKIIFSLLKFKWPKQLKREPFRRSYKDGFAYLLNQFQNSQEVKSWILKKNYLYYDREN